MSWRRILEERKQWMMTPESLSAWKNSNSALPRLVVDLVPPGGRLLDTGCGPGRHASMFTSMGFDVVGIDVNPEVIKRAKANAEACLKGTPPKYLVADMWNIDAIARSDGPFDAVVHGGVVEHFCDRDEIVQSLSMQVQVAPVVAFDVPILTQRNLRLFAGDGIFRNVWEPAYWTDVVLGGFDLIASHVELKSDGMTDDLVVALRGEQR